MLIITRHTCEDVLIRVPGHPDIRIRLMQINHAQNTVRLGIDAPPDVEVIREELAATWKNKLRKTE